MYQQYADVQVICKLFERDQFCVIRTITRLNIATHNLHNIDNNYFQIAVLFLERFYLFFKTCTDFISGKCEVKIFNRLSVHLKQSAL